MKFLRLFCVIIWLCVCKNQLQLNAQIIRGPYLQNPTLSSIIIKWRTALPSGSWIKIGNNPQSLYLNFGDTNLVLDHSVNIKNLNSNFTYYYAVETDTGLIRTPDFWFKTFPSDSEYQSLRVWTIGDFGRGDSFQQKARNAFPVYTGSKPADIWLWLGDNAYLNGTDTEYQNNVFDSVYGYKNIMHHLPFLPTPGNHDYNTISTPSNSVFPLNQTGPYFNIIDVPKAGESGGFPSGNELYYSFNYGNVHFISLNSELASTVRVEDDWIGVYSGILFQGSPMTEWLKQDLSENKQMFTVVYFHQPPHTDGTHSSRNDWEIQMKAMRENFAPIIESYGVDLVLCGHSHDYERSYLMRGFYGSFSNFKSQNIVQKTGGTFETGGEYEKFFGGPYPSSGTIYAVVGNSGSRATTAFQLKHPAMFTSYGCDTCVGSLFLDFSSLRMEGHYIDGNGQERDHFVIVKKPWTPDPHNSNGSIRDCRIYPNPTKNEAILDFKLNAPGITEISLTDEQGRKRILMHENKVPGDYSFSIHGNEMGLRSGTYAVMIQTGKWIIKKKLIVID